MSYVLGELRLQPTPIPAIDPLPIPLYYTTRHCSQLLGLAAGGSRVLKWAWFFFLVC